MFNSTLIDITQKIMEETGDSVSYDEARELATLPEKDTLDLIFFAGKIRNKFQKKIFKCSIINAKSGACSQDCTFCAQSVYHKTGVKKYPLLSKQELVNNAVLMYKAGATQYSMVTSGYMLNDKEINIISQAAVNIKEKTDLNLCCSPGIITKKMAEKLKQSGMINYHHNLETARSYFDKICTTHEYDEDIEAIKLAKSCNLNVCSGGILGLGESWNQRIELAFTLKELNVDSVALNFLNPVFGTKMENRPLMKPMQALKSIALFRFILPEKNITICGGREVVLKDYQSWLFAAGANGLMIGNYLTTKGRSIDMDIEMIKEMNFENDRK
ncbi:Biotin synthase [Candidatus Magnetomoraceae bacterium gMMP-15]